MQDQNHTAEIDPWDEWLAEASQQYSGQPALRSDSKQAECSSSSEQCSGSNDCLQADSLNAEVVSTPVEGWIVPSVEEIERLVTGIESVNQASECSPENRVGSAVGVTTETQEPTNAISEGTNRFQELFAVSDKGTVPSPSNGYALETVLESIDEELREAYLDDANTCMGAMEAAVLLLDQDCSNHEAARQVSRQLHTLKGASASVGLKGLADRLHDVEEKLRQDQVQGNPTTSEFLLESLDWIRCQLALVRNRNCKEPFGSGESQTSLRTNQLLQGDAGHSSLGNPCLEPLSLESPDDDDSVRVKTSQINRLMDLLAGLVMLRNRRQTETSDLREVYHELNGVVSKLKLLSSFSAKTLQHCEPGREESDEECPTPGRLLITGDGSVQLTEIAADVQEMCQRLRDCTRPVTEGNEAVSQFIRQFRQELVELRRAPFNGLFQRLQRAVRDAGQAEGKSVKLECKGASSTVERSLQQRLYEPLLHIVRNAVCHGIERPEVRQVEGKAPTGLITLEVTSAADLLSIQICDDGAGLNYQAIRQKAIERGMLASDYSPTEQELSQYIFHPGFSTRSSATQQAGRGIGMDIVATTLSRLGGWIDVSSVTGSGTTIRLNVPLRSAIDHLMVFRSGTQHYALPLLAIRSAGAVDVQCPAVPLTALLAQQVCEDDQATSSLVLDLEHATDRSATCQPSQINLLVDEIVGPEEVVVRPMPSLLRAHPYCSGATLGSAGQTVLVLDSRRLLNWLTNHQPVRQPGDGLTAQNAHREQSPLSVTADRPSTRRIVDSTEAMVLVVDDSVSSRKSVVRSLSRYPLRIVEATDGRQALQLMRSHRFAAIFSDLEMPHIDGLEFLTEVRSREGQSCTPFTIISSRQEKVFKSKAESLGVTNYLPKPINDAVLDSVLLGVPALACLIQLPAHSIRS